MDRITNAWRLSKSSWAVLRRDRELVAIPLLTGIGALAVLVVFAVPALMLAGGPDTSATGPAVWLVGLVGLVAATWVATIGQAAVVAGAGERMDGGDPTIGSSLAAAGRRAFRLLEWAVLATVVAIILDQIEERLGVLGRVVSWMGQVAFSVMSFLALPVIVFEDVGAIEGFKRSSSLLRSTWGEQVSFSFGLGLLAMVALFGGLVVAGLVAATGILALQIIAVAAAVAWVAVVLSVQAALSGVFKAALYRWARGLPTDPAFSETDLSGAFRPR